MPIEPSTIAKLENVCIPNLRLPVCAIMGLHLHVLDRNIVGCFGDSVRSRFFYVSHRLHPILQPCPLWPFPFLERLVDTVLSSKINHPRLAQPKLVLERSKNRMNRVPIRPQFAKFFVPHGDIVGCFVDYVKERWRNVNPPPLLCPPFFATFAL